MVGKRILGWVTEGKTLIKEREDTDTSHYPGKKVTDHELYKG